MNAPTITPPKHTNFLATEKSPYLLQHAHNPVQWYPWGDAAFEKARSEDKPILLSIGYSTCHWCHVMERESFEDEKVGKYLNDHFVSIKLDREERTWSERLLRSRTYNNPKVLNDYYRVVVETFWVRMQSEMAHLPRDVEARNLEISARLAQLNPILARLDRRLAADLYKGFVGLAEETAKSSGGFLRIGAIGTEENEWIKLPMLAPVVAPPRAPEPEKNMEGD